MSEFNYNREYNPAEYGHTSALTETKVFRNVYLWMTFALTITGLVSYYVSHSYEILSFIFGSKIAFWGLIIAEFGLVIGLNAAINKISAVTATIIFMLYSVINGVLLSSIFLVYEMGSIATTFLVTAGTFGVMALWGSVTNVDLSKFRNILFMALIGLILASVVNIFLKNSMMDLVISWVGVVIFVGLTAYDANKIKAMLYGAEENETTQKIAVLGALTLYLDFVNMFIYLLRILGKRN